MKPKKNTYFKQVNDGIAFYFHFLNNDTGRYCGFCFEKPTIEYFGKYKMGTFVWRDRELCSMDGFKPISKREYTQALRASFKALLSEKTTVKKFA